MVGLLARLYHPRPAPPAFGGDKVNPEQKASLLSRVTLGWLSPLITVGFTRPLQQDDLWHLAPHHLTAYISDRLQSTFYGCSIKTSHTSPEHSSGSVSEDDPPKKVATTASSDLRLISSINKSFFWAIWPPGVLKFASALLLTTAPLVSKALINYLTAAYNHYRFPETTPDPPPIGVGLGLAFGLFGMQTLASICENHYAQITMTNGLLLRSAIIDNVFRKCLRLSGRARLEHNNGQITNIISKDSTRLENSITLVHSLWVTPIQIIVGVALLIRNLGVSAVIGVGVMLGLFPIQGIAFAFVLQATKRLMSFTDSRVRIMQEVLYGIRTIKLFASEDFYARKILTFRRKELKMIRNVALGLAVVMSSISFVPVIGATTSFIAYAVAGNELSADVIFSSMQLFDIIRMPLVALPMIFGAAIDAYVSLGRISKLLAAEDIPQPPPLDLSSPHAIVVENADFTWEKPANDKQSKKPIVTTKAECKEDTLPTASSKAEEGEEVQLEQKPFELKQLNIKIDRGAFIVIVGRVGSGKSSLMNAMIGEMRKTRGKSVFGGRLAYVPQASWIMNASLEENITWSELNDTKYQELIRACCLEPDVAILPQGDQTEIGERGINLSGGQKARVGLARAAFTDAPIVLLDDPLSALDAAVGKSILEYCLLTGPLADKTRILVTHSLHVLPHADYIYMMENGEIKECGTYSELLEKSLSFARLVEEFGSNESSEKATATVLERNCLIAEKQDPAKGNPLMEAEERVTGQVTLETYKAYLQAAGGLGWAPVLIFFLLMTQVSQVVGRLVLSFWTSQTIPTFSDKEYQALYGGLGAAQAVFAFLGCFSFSLAGIKASSRLFSDGLWGVLRAPMLFYEVTPMGRIISRLSADLAKIDTQLAITFYFLASTASAVLGVIALVFYVYPYLGIMFFPLGILYWLAMAFYRRTSIELKRLDSILRSNLYASYTEALTGLATIRASREQERFIQRTEAAIDLQNRAGYMAITAQRWLSLRLDMLGNVLVLGICLFSVLFRETVDPSKVGLVLTYTLSITSVLSELVSRFAQTEQDMNAIERINFYAALTPEAPPTTPFDPPPTWPTNGALSFKDVTMKYRPDLPSVLHNVTFTVNAGEKIGIVGRTGAGKSSLLQALFRIVEVESGELVIDGVNIRTIGLDVLRRQLAVIPQDSLLFEGTIRENIDPQTTRTDAELITALQKTWLLPSNGGDDPTAEAKFSLDSRVEHEGSNFSAGERQLVALTRALVKGSKVIVLDEATSNVDVETDSKVQKTIQTHFSLSTLLCIAHRLKTIVHYDRILVMDSGKVAEFDTPLKLYDRSDSIFRSLCDQGKVTRADMVRIRTGYSAKDSLPVTSSYFAV